MYKHYKIVKVVLCCFAILWLFCRKAVALFPCMGVFLLVWCLVNGIVQYIYINVRSLSWTLFNVSVELPPKKPLQNTLSVDQGDDQDSSIDLSRQLSLKLSGPLSPAALKSVRGSSPMHWQTDRQTYSTAWQALKSKWWGVRLVHSEGQFCT